MSSARARSSVTRSSRASGIFALSEDGITYVMEAGPEFAIVGTNDLDEMALATPAIARGSLLLRTQSKLYRVTNDTP